mmetsp:Transcript_24598/g.73135  ORF Transcript_24598/g.73135 Transcript_24598/m.73135 type:complete len:254 (-) Transcript_24598:96-857(-)
MWKSGIVLLHTSSGFISTVDAMHRAPQAMFSCVSGTIFGFFVVPEVWSTSARSERFTESKGLPIAEPLRGRPAVCFFKEKRPAMSGDGISSSSFSTLAFRATSTASCVRAFSSSLLSESFACTTRAFAGRSRNSNSYSSLLRPRFSGAKVHRSEKAKKHTASSGPLGMAVQRRSTRSRPSTSTASLTQNSLSFFRESGCRPSVECRKGSSLSGSRSKKVVHSCDRAAFAKVCRAGSCLSPTSGWTGPTSCVPE